MFRHIGMITRNKWTLGIHMSSQFTASTSCGATSHVKTAFLTTSVPVTLSSWRTLRWRHNELHGVSDHQPHDCLLRLLFRRRSKKTSKLRVTGLCVGTSPGPVNSPHKGPVTRKMFPFDDVIMKYRMSIVRVLQGFPCRHKVQMRQTHGLFVSNWHWSGLLC